MIIGYLSEITNGLENGELNPEDSIGGYVIDEETGHLNVIHKVEGNTVYILGGNNDC